MDIVKRNKDVSPMWKKKKKNIGTMGHVGPWARPRKPLLRAAKILN